MCSLRDSLAQIVPLLALNSAAAVASSRQEQLFGLQTNLKSFTQKLSKFD